MVPPLTATPAARTRPAHGLGVTNPPDFCYDAINDPSLYADTCKWQSRFQWEHFEHWPYVGWIVTGVLGVVLILAYAGTRKSSPAVPHPPGSCGLCGSTRHSTEYHRGRGGS